MKDRERIAVVWLKRDLRLHDNEAIMNAVDSGYRTLFLYVFEDALLEDSHYSERHWNFVKQSIHDLNKQLEELGTQVLAPEGDVIQIFRALQNHFEITSVYSHLETGLRVSFDRDLEFKKYCQKNSIEWIENINNAVLRGLKNRSSWFENWESYMLSKQINFRASASNFFSMDELKDCKSDLNLTDLETKNDKTCQPGGISPARKYLDSFLRNRHENYMFHISKPEASRTSCSRLSPYLAWGNLSVREVFQKAQEVKKTSKNKRHLGAFLSRLRWQAHFIQKFEMECSMEEVSVNKGYHKLQKSESIELHNAWILGKTGFPLVDAAMRCLNATGYINFRMRAMLVSFYTHILWQPWQNASNHLAQQFLDFEPGIHYPQIQMQAGETGINSLRIYNPIKNSQDHDPEGLFIKKWVPELENLSLAFVHEPYLMTQMDQQFSNCVLGEDYPNPIVDIKVNRKKASDILWGMRKEPEVQKDSLRVLEKHTISRRNRLLKNG